MSQFHREFTMYYKKSRKRKGIVFKRRYSALIVQKEKYYCNIIRHIFYNLVRAVLAENSYEQRSRSLNYTVNKYVLGEIKWFDKELSISCWRYGRIKNILAKDP